MAHGKIGKIYIIRNIGEIRELEEIKKIIKTEIKKRGNIMNSGGEEDWILGKRGQLG